MLWLLPLGSIASIIPWFVERQANDISDLDLYTLPVMAVIFLALTIWLWRRPKQIDLVILAVLAVLAAYELADFSLIALPTIHGDFGELDCSGPTPRMLVLTQSGPVALLMDQPDRIIISGLGSATVDLSCGKQKSATVSIQYEPATDGQTGVEGSVRTIKFEGRNQME